MSVNMETCLIVDRWPKQMNLWFKNAFHRFLYILEDDVKVWAVAVRWVFGLLACTQHDRFALFRSEAQRRDAWSFALVSSITERLKKKDVCTYNNFILTSDAFRLPQEELSGHRTSTAAEANGSKGERAVRGNPHLFLTVSACTPGVAFLSRNFHPIGQSSSRDALGGLQACLNLRVTSIIMYDSEHVYEQTIDLHLILWPTEVSIGQQRSKQWANITSLKCRLKKEKTIGYWFSIGGWEN